MALRLTVYLRTSLLQEVVLRSKRHQLARLTVVSQPITLFLVTLLLHLVLVLAPFYFVVFVFPFPTYLLSL